ncbi:hypothetical protein CXF76_08015 [Pseudoalteromonas sp. 78C3]|nr:hypothetical protein CXF76_08015 [Pseudoalteromonas sp. 78C3]
MLLLGLVNQFNCCFPVACHTGGVVEISPIQLLLQPLFTKNSQSVLQSALLFCLYLINLTAYDVFLFFIF